jgi:hypothetical protein
MSFSRAASNSRPEPAGGTGRRRMGFRGFFGRVYSHYSSDFFRTDDVPMAALSLSGLWLLHIGWAATHVKKSRAAHRAKPPEGSNHLNAGDTLEGAS